MHMLRKDHTMPSPAGVYAQPMARRRGPKRKGRSDWKLSPPSISAAPCTCLAQIHLALALGFVLLSGTSNTGASPAASCSAEHAASASPCSRLRCTWGTPPANVSQHPLVIMAGEGSSGTTWVSQQVSRVMDQDVYHWKQCFHLSTPSVINWTDLPIQDLLPAWEAAKAARKRTGTRKSRWMHAFASMMKLGPADRDEFDFRLFDGMVSFARQAPSDPIHAWSSLLHAVSSRCSIVVMCNPLVPFLGGGGQHTVLF